MNAAKPPADRGPRAILGPPANTGPVRRPTSLLNELLDNRLSTTSTRVSNSAAQATKTTTYPSGQQSKGRN
jgi:hypothetical protein